MARGVVNHQDGEGFGLSRVRSSRRRIKTSLPALASSQRFTGWKRKALDHLAIFHMWIGWAKSMPELARHKNSVSTKHAGDDHFYCLFRRQAMGH